MIVSALLLAATATAKDIAPAGSADLLGVVEIPLYTAPSAADSGWYVEGTINGKPVLLLLASEQVGLQLTAEAAGRVGLKLSGKEGAQRASVSSLGLGTASLTGIKASIGGGGGAGVDGRLGLASWEGVAWAILPSSGVVRLGPAGPQSVASELGADATYRSTDKTKERIGTGKVEIPATAMAAQVTVSGVELSAALATGAERGWVATEVDEGQAWYSLKGVAPLPATPLPAVNGYLRGDVEMEWREVGLGGTSAWARVDRSGAGTSFPYVEPARVGFDVLQQFDLGVDPSRHAVTLRPSKGNAAKSYAPLYVARMEATLAESGEPSDDVAAARKALAGKLAPMVGAYSAVGQYAKAVEAAQKWTEAAPERCTSWHALGSAMLAAGNPAGAVEPLRKAAAMYQPWAVRPLAERRELEASEDKRASRPDFDGVYAQPHSCHTAWGDAATALLASGKGEAVAELYPAHLDLDAGLARAAGNAALVAGNAAGAEAAFRQAVKLSYTTDERARAGMMLATRARSADLALAQFSGNPDSDVYQLRYFLVYADVLHAARGHDGAVAELSAFLARAPWSAAAWLALAQLQGTGDAGAASRAKAEVLVAHEVAWNGGRAHAHALQAEVHRLAGRLSEAAASADRALELDAALPEAWFVRARVAETAGDAARARELRARAFALAAADPLYASLVAGEPG